MRIQKRKQTKKQNKTKQNTKTKSKNKNKNKTKHKQTNKNNGRKMFFVETWNEIIRKGNFESFIMILSLIYITIWAGVLIQMLAGSIINTIKTFYKFTCNMV